MRSRRIRSFGLLITAIAPLLLAGSSHGAPTGAPIPVPTQSPFPTSTAKPEPPPMGTVSIGSPMASGTARIDWHAGTKEKITWSMTNTTSNLATIWVTSATGKKTTIASALSGTSYEWFIPFDFPGGDYDVSVANAKDLRVGDTHLVRITAAKLSAGVNSGRDVDSCGSAHVDYWSYSLAAPLTVKVFQVAPNGGLTLKEVLGSALQFTQTTPKTDKLGTVYLLSGHTSWRAPEVAQVTPFAIEVTSNVAPKLTDRVDFKVKPPWMTAADQTVRWPNSPDGQTIYTEWHYGGCVDGHLAKVELFDATGTHKIVTVTTTASFASGKHTWQLPPGRCGSYIVKITNLSDARFVAQAKLNHTDTWAGPGHGHVDKHPKPSFCID